MICTALRYMQTFPPIGFGTANTTAGGSATATDVACACVSAFKLGCRHFDCAPLYGNQRELGEHMFAPLLRGDLGAPGATPFWVTSKLWLTNFAAEHVRPAVEETLESLQLAHRGLDLFIMHAPVALRHVGIPLPANSTPRDEFGNAELSGVSHGETWAAMEALIPAGLTRHIGVSNFSLPELDALLGLPGSSVKPLCNQIELHPYHQQQALVDGCLARGVTPVAFSPLGSGPNRVLSDGTLQRMASSKGVSTAQLVLAWNVQRGVIVIPHSLEETEIAENLAAGAIQLTAQEMAVIARLERFDRSLVLNWGDTSPGVLLEKAEKRHRPRL
eukprot:SAG31_NODE_2706_length_5214_cov_12.707136_2_plen_331_part_00